MGEPIIDTVSKSFIVPHGCANARAYLCTPIDDVTASRSTVLTTLTECEGIVELPEGVALYDLWRWSNLHPSHTDNLSSSDLSHALKVGDRIGDKHAKAFAKAMAKMLARTTWSDSEDCEQLKEAYISMHSNLRALVAQQGNDWHDAFETEAEKWPMAIQHAYVDALVETGTIELPHSLSSSAAQAVMFILSRASTTDRLSRLAVNYTPSYQLHSLQPEAVLSALPAIGSLSHLTSLLIGLRIPARNLEEHPALPNALGDLSATIPYLPNLSTFSLEMLSTAEGIPAPLPPAKRHKMGSMHTSSPALCLDPLIKALSVAPSLTSLCFTSCFMPEECNTIPCSGIRGPFQTLKQLTISIPAYEPNHYRRQYEELGEVSGAGGIVPVAPLPCLTALHFANRAHRLVRSANTKFLRYLAQQTSLEFAQLQFRTLPVPAAPAADLFSSGVQALTRLRALELSLSYAMRNTPVQTTAAIAAVAQLTAVTALQLEVPDVNRETLWPMEEAQAQAQASLAVLSQLTGLQDLQYRAISYGVDGGTHISVLPSLMGALPALTQLTRLGIAAFEPLGKLCEIPPDALANLPRLPHVQILGVMGAPGTGESFQWLPGVLHASLTSLQLRITGSGGSTLHNVAQSLSAATAQAVRRVDLFVEDETRSLNWLQGLLGMPVRGEYRVCWSWQYGSDEDELGEVKDAAEELQACGFTVDEVAEDRLVFKAPAMADAAVGAAGA